MLDPQKHFDCMLFNNETTYRTDLRGSKIKHADKTVYKEKSNCLRVPPSPIKFLHTLCDWRVPNIPINLFVKPKDIVHTNPKVIQKAYGPPIDLKREEIQKTRPRVFMCPAISMDDIKDPAVRRILTDDVYTTTSMKKFCADNTNNQYSVIAPLPNVLSKPNPIVLERLKMPFVSTEWRMNSISWDQKQLRSYADYTKDFWLGEPLSDENCKETI